MNVHRKLQEAPSGTQRIKEKKCYYHGHKQERLQEKTTRLFTYTTSLFTAGATLHPSSYFLQSKQSSQFRRIDIIACKSVQVFLYSFVWMAFPKSSQDICRLCQHVFPVRHECLGSRLYPVLSGGSSVSSSPSPSLSFYICCASLFPRSQHHIILQDFLTRIFTYLKRLIQDTKLSCLSGHILFFYLS